MGNVLTAAGRRALAAALLFVTAVLAVWVWMFEVGHPDFPLAGGKAITPAMSAQLSQARCAIGTNYCDGVRPGWTIPVGMAILLIGVVLAAVIHRSRKGPPTTRRAVL